MQDANAVTGMAAQVDRRSAMDLELEVGLRWWVRPYIYTLVLFCWITGMQPDEQKLQRKLFNGIWVRAK